MVIGIIYSFKSPSGKYYIGQTIDEYRRYKEHMRLSDGSPALNNAIQKYGFDNLEYKIILRIECNTKEECTEVLNILEKFYIDKYDSFHNGYNCNAGGGAQSGFEHSEETKKILHDKNQYLGRQAWNIRAVQQFSLDGKFIAEYSSLKIAAKETNSNVPSICRVCLGLRKHHKGYVWKYKESPTTISKESTSEANADGSGEPHNNMSEDIV